jgi:predicted  nucleic acid-binding Zn-ribbon protein
MQRKKSNYKSKKKREPYLVKEYYCTRCGHFFHSARLEIIQKCNKCDGYVEVRGRYKSRKAPGISRKKPGGQWISPSEIFYYDRNRDLLRKKI